MSNVGKELIKIPKGIEVEINEQVIKVKGPQGILEKKLPKNIILIQKNERIYFFPVVNLSEKKIKEKCVEWGTVRTFVNNMIKGVNQGFNVKLQLVGIGYKIFLENNNVLNFKLGYSHNIYYEVPAEIKVQLLKPTLLSIHGMDYEFVTRVAAKLRSFRKPEPYKGKGIRYVDEIIFKKEGKKK